ncbi:unnamed protein product, partial [Larinioides sclopetarius]
MGTILMSLFYGTFPNMAVKISLATLVGCLDAGWGSLYSLSLISSRKVFRRSSDGR